MLIGSSYGYLFQIPRNIASNQATNNDGYNEATRLFLLISKCSLEKANKIFEKLWYNEYRDSSVFKVHVTDPDGADIGQHLTKYFIYEVRKNIISIVLLFFMIRLKINRQLLFFYCMIGPYVARQFRH